MKKPLTFCIMWHIVVYTRTTQGIFKVLEGEEAEEGESSLRCLKETSSEMQAECSSNVESQWSWSYWRETCISSIRYGYRIIFLPRLNVNPEKPDWEDRDRFLLSAGHKSMVQYAVLAEKGYFPKEILDTYGHLHSKLAGHPNMHKLR